NGCICDGERGVYGGTRPICNHHHRHPCRLRQSIYCQHLILCCGYDPLGSRSHPPLLCNEHHDPSVAFRACRVECHDGHTFPLSYVHQIASHFAGYRHPSSRHAGRHCHVHLSAQLEHVGPVHV